MELWEPGWAVDGDVDVGVDVERNVDVGVDVGVDVDVVVLFIAGELDQITFGGNFQLIWFCDSAILWSNHTALQLHVAAMGFGIAGQGFTAQLLSHIQTYCSSFMSQHLPATWKHHLFYTYIYIHIHSSVFTQEQAVFHCWKSSKWVPTAAIQLRSQRRWERNESSKNKCSGVGWQDPFCLSLPDQGSLHWLQMQHPVRITASLCGTQLHTGALLAAFLGWKEAQHCPCTFFSSMSERWGVLKWWHKTGRCSQGPRTPAWAVCTSGGFSFQFSCNYLLWSINYIVFI